MKVTLIIAKPVFLLIFGGVGIGAVVKVKTGFQELLPVGGSLAVGVELYKDAMVLFEAPVDRAHVLVTPGKGLIVKGTAAGIRTELFIRSAEQFPSAFCTNFGFSTHTGFFPF